MTSSLCKVYKYFDCSLFITNNHKFQSCKNFAIDIANRTVNFTNIAVYCTRIPSRTTTNLTSVYLDYNATTPLEEEVLNTICTTLKDAWGNPSSSYDAGVKAKKAVCDARSMIAKMINGKDSDIIFTSGGTEANNMILRTALKAHQLQHVATTGKRKPHFITSNLEHDSIKLVLEAFERENTADVTYVPASFKTGRVEVSDVIAAIRPDTIMISIMMANNETGVIQPITEISEGIKSLHGDVKYHKIYLHTDAAQAIGKIPVDVQKLGVDFLTIVGHKFYGPRIGALFVLEPQLKTPIYPMFYGGGQERNIRPGTENTGMIAGLGKAAELVVYNLAQYRNHMESIRNYLEEQLQASFPEQVTFNGKFECSERLPNTCNVSVLGKGLEGSRVLSNTRSTVIASTGAACHSSCGKRASPILLAIGIPVDIAANAMRLSVGRHTSKNDIDFVIKQLKSAVEKISQENGD